MNDVRCCRRWRARKAAPVNADRFHFSDVESVMSLAVFCSLLPLPFPVARYWSTNNPTPQSNPNTPLSCLFNPSPSSFFYFRFTLILAPSLLVISQVISIAFSNINHVLPIIYVYIYIYYKNRLKFYIRSKNGV